MSKLDRYLLRCAGLIGIPCLLLSLMVAQFLPDFTWQGVAIGTLGGMLVSVPMVCRAINQETRDVSNAVVESAGQVAMAGLRATGLEIDHRVVAQDIERLSREKLKGKAFYSLDWMAETAIPTEARP